jgi:integrase
MELTQKRVDAIPSEIDGITWDDEVAGLGLRVQNGKRTWVCRYRVGGVQKQKTLGPGTLPLRKARVAASEVIADARRGHDAVARTKAEKAARGEAEQARRREEEVRRARSLKVIVERYLAHAGQELRPATVRELRRSLGTHWQPLHDLIADALDRRTIVERLEAIQAERGAATARAARAYLSMACAWGVARGLLDRNPVIGLKPLTASRARDRVLTAEELARVWHAADPASDFGAIVRLLLLTGQRREEVAAMGWGELDLGRGRWLLPARRTKNRRPHEVPLSRQALAIITARPRRPGRDYVFGEGKGPFSNWSSAKKMLDARIAATGGALPAWRLHDLRRSAITHMAEVGIAPHVIEAIVNHVSGHKAGVAGVYNRATYAIEKRDALRRWANHLEAVVDGQEFGAVPLSARTAMATSSL